MRKTVLVVDDNEANMRLFCDLIEAEGHRAVKAEYGMKGLRLVREARPNLILMDIQLPDVAGTEVIQWIKSDKALRHIPIIATTAFNTKEIIDAIAASGCDGYITKPIAVSEFLDTVHHFLSGTSAKETKK